MAHSRRAQCLAYPTDNSLLTGSEEGAIRLWDTRAGSSPVIHIPRAHQSRVKGIAPSSSTPAELGLVSSASSDGVVKLWDFRKLTAEPQGISSFKLQRRFNKICCSRQVQDFTRLSFCLSPVFCSWSIHAFCKASTEFHSRLTHSQPCCINMGGRKYARPNQGVHLGLLKVPLTGLQDKLMPWHRQLQGRG